jgi:ankyrin repeat protein
MRLQILPADKAKKQAQAKLAAWKRKKELTERKISLTQRAKNAKSEPHNMQKKKSKRKYNPKKTSEQERLNKELRKLARGKAEDIEKAMELIKQGADVNSISLIPSQSRRSALDQAVNYNHLKMARFLIENGADVNFRDDIYHQTPLMTAVGKRNIKMVKLLLENGANINAKDNHGNTALINASPNCPTEIVRLLLENEADVNATNDHGETALIRTAFTASDISIQVDNVRLLIENGANFNVINNDGNTALMVALRFGNTVTAKLLKQHGAKE